MDRAISDYNKALDLKSDVDDGYWYRGDAYLTEEKYSEAISDFNRAISLKPDDPSYRVSRGVAYTKRGLTDVVRTRGYLWPTSTGDYDKAINDFDYFVTRYPEESIGYSLRSTAPIAKAMTETPDKRNELRNAAELDFERSKKLLTNHRFDIEERNTVSRT